MKLAMPLGICTFWRAIEKLNQPQHIQIVDSRQIDLITRLKAKLSEEFVAPCHEAANSPPMAFLSQRTDQRFEPIYQVFGHKINRVHDTPYRAESLQKSRVRACWYAVNAVGAVGEDGKYLPAFRQSGHGIEIPVCC